MECEETILRNLFSVNNYQETKSIIEVERLTTHIWNNYDKNKNSSNCFSFRNNKL